MKQLLLVNKFNSRNGTDTGEVISIHPESYIFCVDQKFNHDVVIITDEQFKNIKDKWIDSCLDGEFKMIYDHDTKEIYFKDV